MHAKMSDRNARAATFDTMPRTSWMLPSERVWTVEDLWAWSAEAEARAILAETEPTHPERWTLYDSRGRREGLNSALTSERLALAESLRSFLADDRPFVVEATAPRCMTGRPLRVQRRA